MARKKKSNNWVAFVVVVIGVVIYNVLTTDGGKRGQPAKQTAAPAPIGLERIDLYARNGVRNDWPSLSDANAVVQQDQLAKNYYVILDDSGSMKSDKCAVGHASRLSAAIDALAAFADGLPSQANLGVMSFDGGRFSELIPLGKRRSDEIRRLGRRMTPGGSTPLATAITNGYAALRKQGVAQLGYGEYHLVVITDGQASDREYPDAIVEQMLTESPVDIHTIGFCIDTDHVLNQPRYLSYQPADNVQALRQGLQDVLAEAPEFTVSSFK